MTDKTQHRHLSNREVKKIVGAALTSTDGVLDEEDSLIDFFKGEDNPTRGIKVHIDAHNNAEVSAKVIVEAGRDVKDVLSRATGKVVESLKKAAGLNVTSINIKAATP